MIHKIYHKTKNYAQIDNKLLEDPRLSYKAKGVLCYLLSKPEGWIVRVEDMVAHGQDGRSAVKAALKELKKAGYAALRMERTADQRRLAGYHWAIYEDPAEACLSTRKPVRQTTCQTENRTLSNTYRERNTNAAPRKAATGTERNGFDLEEVEQTPMLQFARSFAKWSTKHNLHALQRGSTKTGWKPTTVKAWSRIAQSLLLSLNEDVDRIKAVWKWYQLHYGDDYVPECRTLKSFCERFLSIEAAMRRASRPLSRKAQAAQEEEDIGTGTRITDEFLERQGIDPKSVRRVARYQEGDELR